MSSRLADIVAEFVTQLSDASVGVAIGRKELHRLDAPPRVVFERVGGPVDMTQEVGRQDIAGTNATRQLWQRNLTVRLHCWGADEEQAEQLLHNALVALRRAALGSVTVGSENWEHEPDAGDVELGEVVTVEVALAIPVLDRLVALAIPPVGGWTFTKASDFNGEAGFCGLPDGGAFATETFDAGFN
jgi:hypothetical protein